MNTSLVAAVALALATPLAFAQGGMERGGMGKGMNGGGKAGAGASGEMHQHMMQGARQSMRMKASGDVDRDFATMMRQHHQTGIRMAQDEVTNGKDPKMKELAQKILDSQQEEMKQFDQWLAENKGPGGSAAGGSSRERSKGGSATSK